MFKKVGYMLSVKSNLMIFFSLALMTIAGTFTCQDLHAMLNYDKHKEKLKKFDIPSIQNKLKVLDDSPPDTIATRIREEINGLHVEVEYFEEEMDGVWEDVDDNRIEIRRLKRYIYEQELLNEGTELQNGETTTQIITGGGIIGGVLLGFVRIFWSSIAIWGGTLPDKLVKLATKHKEIKHTKKKTKRKKTT